MREKFKFESAVFISLVVNLIIIILAILENWKFYIIIIISLAQMLITFFFDHLRVILNKKGGESTSLSILKNLPAILMILIYTIYIIYIIKLVGWVVSVGIILFFLDQLYMFIKTKKINYDSENLDIDSLKGAIIMISILILGYIFSNGIISVVVFLLFKMLLDMYSHLRKYSKNKVIREANFSEIISICIFIIFFSIVFIPDFIVKLFKRILYGKPTKKTKLEVRPKDYD